MHKLAFVLALAVAACGGKSSSTPTTPEPPMTEKAPAGLSSLELGELKIVDTEKNEAILIHADGKIEIGGQVLASVTADGKLRNQASGEDVLMLEADGSLKVKSGQIPPVVFAADGTVTADGKTISIDAEGKIVGGEEAAPLKVEGATTPGLKRTALFVLVGLMMGGQPQPAPAETAPKG
ncbi:MAG: hypothetical protein SFX73_11460 [Kofleriaceae bacterium]|nr:hypothetical protein [Kofleriaceae bacterium]